MRESFVFHFEYIEDIPEELQHIYAMYIINYARFGTEPEFTEWQDIRIWNQIKKRIDAESEKYYKKCRNLKNNPPPEPSEPQHTKPQMNLEPETNDKDQQSENPEEKTVTAKQRFQKPTEEEVRSYCKERENGIDADSFFNYYESKGWKIGNTAMKDWKAAVRTWEQRRKSSAQYSETVRELPPERLTL